MNFTTKVSPHHSVVKFVVLIHALKSHRCVYVMGKQPIRTHTRWYRWVMYVLENMKLGLITFLILYTKIERKYNQIFGVHFEGVL